MRKLHKLAEDMVAAYDREVRNMKDKDDKAEQA